MAKLTSWTCDVCGVQKQEANHWWTYHSRGSGDHSSVPIIRIWNWGDCNIPEIGHLCGEQCVLKKVAEIMGSLGK